MSGRRIDLNLSAPDSGASPLPGRDGQSLASAPREPPGAQDEARFAAALAAEADADPETPADLASSEMPRPFALFGGPSPGAASPDRALPSALGEHLNTTVERLMVGEGRHGRQVRMAIRDDLLPGVTIAIEEQEGRLQVDFFCRIERSRLLLGEALPDMAPTLARRLQRAVLMRVQTDDDEDPCLLEQLALA